MGLQIPNDNGDICCVGCVTIIRDDDYVVVVNDRWFGWYANDFKFADVSFVLDIWCVIFLIQIGLMLDYAG